MNIFIIWGVISIILLIIFPPLGVLSLIAFIFTAIIAKPGKAILKSIEQLLNDIHTIAENSKKER